MLPQLAWGAASGDKRHVQALDFACFAAFALIYLRMACQESPLCLELVESFGGAASVAVLSAKVLFPRCRLALGPEAVQSREASRR